MRNSTLLCWRDLLGIASEMLEILTRILTKIFSVSSVCSVDFLLEHNKKGKRRFILYFARFALPLICNPRYFRSEIKINAGLFCISLA